MLRKILSFFFTLSILSLNAAPLFAAECEKTQAIEHLDVHQKKLRVMLLPLLI